jgi:hypothetical protein
MNCSNRTPEAPPRTPNTYGFDWLKPDQARDLMVAWGRDRVCGIVEASVALASPKAGVLVLNAVRLIRPSPSTDR